MQATMDGGKVQKGRQPSRKLFTGVADAARMAGVARTHISAVLRGLRPGSAKVWDAIEAAGVRNGLTGKAAKRPRGAGGCARRSGRGQDSYGNGTKE